MLEENAEEKEIVSQRTWDEMMDQATKLKTNGGWVVKDSVGAKAAEFAITTKHPYTITFIRQEGGTSTLKPSMVSSILANATKRTTVDLNCLDSFFRGGEKSHDWREILSVCLNNDK